MLYICRFIRNDKQPIEEYYYNSYEDAEYHFSLFKDDDSMLYERIELISCETNEIMKTHIFLFTNDS